MMYGTIIVLCSVFIVVSSQKTLFSYLIWFSSYTWCHQGCLPAPALGPSLTACLQWHLLMTPKDLRTGELSLPLCRRSMTTACHQPLPLPPPSPTQSAPVGLDNTPATVSFHGGNGRKCGCVCSNRRNSGSAHRQMTQSPVFFFFYQWDCWAL